MSKQGGPTIVLHERPHDGSIYPDGIAVDDKYVYFADFFGTSIYKLPKDGGALAVVATAGLYPRAVTLDATCVYWTTDAGLGPTFGTIMKAPK